jgi:hypothetical protein
MKLTIHFVTPAQAGAPLFSWLIRPKRGPGLRRGDGI